MRLNKKLLAQSKMEDAPVPPLVLLRPLIRLLPVAGWLKTGTPEPPLPPLRAPRDSIRINVTTLKDDGEVSKKQVILNITYESGQVYM